MKTIDTHTILFLTKMYFSMPAQCFTKVRFKTLYYYTNYKISTLKLKTVLDLLTQVTLSYNFKCFHMCPILTLLPYSALHKQRMLNQKRRGVVRSVLTCRFSLPVYSWFPRL